MRQPIFQPLFQATDGFRLIAGGTKAECSLNGLLINQNLKKDLAAGV
jgi:hypothetical protein